MTPQEAQKHIEDIKSEISWLLFHKQTLIRKMELLKPKIESQIVKPTRISNISQITEKDIEVDVVQANLATMEVVKAREEYYFAMMDLANVEAAIPAKKEMLVKYIAHIRQELEKQSSSCTDEMIFNTFRRCKDIPDLTEQESEAVKNIGLNMMKLLNGGNKERLELHETLLNIISQHKK